MSIESLRESKGSALILLALAASWPISAFVSMMRRPDQSRALAINNASFPLSAKPENQFQLTIHGSDKEAGGTGAT